VVEQILVFVSHTQEMSQQPKGESYVDGAESAINALDGAKARHMEFFPAADVSPADYSIQQLEDTDIFLAIIGFERGSIVPGEDRSYTELEFDAATQLHKERLLFLLRLSDPAAAQPDPDQVRFRQKLENSGATVSYFTDVGDLKYKVSQAVTRSIKERARKPAGRQAGMTPQLPPVDGQTVAKSLSFAGVLVIVFLALVVLGGWTAFAGVFPPWSQIGECSNVSARVSDTSPTTFGPFSSGAVIDIIIDNRSTNTISIPAARDVTARGSSGSQYSPDDSLADQSWFFGIEVQPGSMARVQLGLASAQDGADTVTVVIPRVRGSEWFLSRCDVATEPVSVTFAG
jgi:Domain of unknown function (DUF4062)